MIEGAVTYVSVGRLPMTPFLVHFVGNERCVECYLVQADDALLSVVAQVVAQTNNSAAKLISVTVISFVLKHTTGVAPTQTSHFYFSGCQSTAVTRET